MNVCVVYAGGANGRTHSVVQAASQRFRFPHRAVAAAAADPARDVAPSDLLILFSPTYGDEELHADMEAFLVGLAGAPRRFVLCELGNYYGYEEPDFGASRIMRSHLESRGWTEAAAALSLDSLPEVDWPELERWADGLNAALGVAP
jgi:hypothetical protein